MKASVTIGLPPSVYGCVIVDRVISLLTSQLTRREEAAPGTAEIAGLVPQGSEWEVGCAASASPDRSRAGPGLRQDVSDSYFLEREN